MVTRLTATARRSLRPNGDAQFHDWHRQQHHQYQPDGCGDYPNRNVWWCSILGQWFQRHAIWRLGSSGNVHGDRSNFGLQLQPSKPVGGHYSNARHRPHHHHHVYRAVVVCVLAIAPAAASEITNVAAPQATSSGSVTNQAVQINQGSYNNQSFGGGLTCSGPTLVFTPFFIGSSIYHQASGNANYGFQMSFSVPLDREAVSLCKDMARAKLSKERLDYELVRVLKCAELLNSGYAIREQSPFAVLCADVFLVPKSKSVARVSSESASTAE